MLVDTNWLKGVVLGDLPGPLLGRCLPLTALGLRRWLGLCEAHVILIEPLFLKCPQKGGFIEGSLVVEN